MVRVPRPRLGSALQSQPHRKPSPDSDFCREINGLTSECQQERGAEAAQVAPTPFPSSSFTSQLLIFTNIPLFHTFSCPPSSQEERARSCPLSHHHFCSTAGCPLPGRIHPSSLPRVMHHPKSWKSILQTSTSPSPLQQAAGNAGRGGHTRVPCHSTSPQFISLFPHLHEWRFPGERDSRASSSRHSLPQYGCAAAGQRDFPRPGLSLLKSLDSICKHRRMPRCECKREHKHQEHESNGLEGAQCAGKRGKSCPLVPAAAGCPATSGSMFYAVQVLVCKRSSCRLSIL